MKLQTNRPNNRQKDGLTNIVGVLMGQVGALIGYIGTSMGKVGPAEGQVGAKEGQVWFSMGKDRSLTMGFVGHFFLII